jgi:hypothetical protein
MNGRLLCLGNFGDGVKQVMQELLGELALGGCVLDIIALPNFALEMQDVAGRRRERSGLVLRGLAVSSRRGLPPLYTFRGGPEALR